MWLHNIYQSPKKHNTRGLCYRLQYFYRIEILCNIFASIGPTAFSLWNDQTPSKGGAHNQNLPWKKFLVASYDDILSNSCTFLIF